MKKWKYLMRKKREEPKKEELKKNVYVITSIFPSKEIQEQVFKMLKKS